MIEITIIHFSHSLNSGKVASSLRELRDIKVRTDKRFAKVVSPKSIPSQSPSSSFIDTKIHGLRMHDIDK